MRTPIAHPSWCHTAACHVRRNPSGAAVGAHRSRPVVIGGHGPGEVEVRLSLWQIDSQPAFVAVDWNRPDGVPVDGVMFDPDEAKSVGRVLRDLAQLAERETPQ